MLDFIIIFLTIIEVIVALMLTGIILIQQSKVGGGLGAMSGGVTETFFGAGAGNVLTKATVILASIFLGTTLLLAIISGQRRPGQSVIEKVPTQNAIVAPADDTQPEEEPAGTAADDSAGASDGPAAAGPAAETPTVATPSETAPETVPAVQAPSEPPAADAAATAPETAE